MNITQEELDKLTAKARGEGRQEGSEAGYASGEKEGRRRQQQTDFHSLLQELQKMKINVGQFNLTPSERDLGYNQALSDIEELIKKII